MNCFNHPDVTAVAICSRCAKGVCRDCAVDLTRATACKDRCEVEVRRLLDLRDFSLSQPAIVRATLQQSKMVQVRAAIGMLITAGMFVLLSVLTRSMAPYFLPLAGAMVLMGVWGLVGSKLRVSTTQFRLCKHCGYNITGNTTDKCPKCGKYT